MRKMLVHLAFGVGALLVPLATAMAANVPCEEALKNLRAAEASSTVTGTDKDKVTELETKGVERCNADDDKRADDFFAQAMKILGK